MTSSLDLDGVLDEITRGLVRDIDAALARIWLVSPDEPGFLHLVASAGLSTRLDGPHGRVPIGALKIGEIALARNAVYTRDLAGDRRFSDKLWIATNQLVSFAGYPLRFDHELLGVLAIFARRELADLELERLAIFAAQASVAIKNAGLFAEVKALTRRLEAENNYLKEELFGRSRVIGKSRPFLRALRALDRVAPKTTTVLLAGETGTGKELFAHALHARSRRAAGPLVKLNCAALPPAILEAELFGHDKGVFGRFELAQGGTLFLDEVSELALETQAKLLHVLREHEIDRVGRASPLRVDARIVAATNRDLGAAVEAGRFRPDLFFRLNVFPIRIPPLRERREDIPLLAEAYLEGRLLSGSEAKTIDADGQAYLKTYDWPGNVRELHNVLERAAILASGAVIGVADLPELTRRKVLGV